MKTNRLIDKKFLTLAKKLKKKTKKWVDKKLLKFWKINKGKLT